MSLANKLKKNMGNFGNIGNKFELESHSDPCANQDSLIP